MQNAKDNIYYVDMDGGKRIVKYRGEYSARKTLISAWRQGCENAVMLTWDEAYQKMLPLYARDIAKRTPHQAIASVKRHMTELEDFEKQSRSGVEACYNADKTGLELLTGWYLRELQRKGYPGDLTPDYNGAVRLLELLPDDPMVYIDAKTSRAVDNAVELLNRMKGAR